MLLVSKPISLASSQSGINMIAATPPLQTVVAHLPTTEITFYVKVMV